MGDRNQQDALADVVELAQLLHALRGLSGEVESLLADGLKVARDAGLSQAVIAEASDLTRGRVSQVVNSGPATTTGEQLHASVFRITEWPGDALRLHRATFAGRMTFPPYHRRRTASQL